MSSISIATAGTSLREPLRSGINDDELAELLSRIWVKRVDKYSELRKPEVGEKPLLSKVEMYRMGG